MKFSPEQDRALMEVTRWLEGGDTQVFRLFGYAGTGKTTLAKHIAEHIDGDVLFAAFTGKAAMVLRARGAKGASTIHSLIYRPRGEEMAEDETTGRNQVVPLFTLNRQSPVANAALIVIDECSMVDEELGRDLLSFGTPVLVLGDPGQLPPVSGGGFFTEEEPDVLLEDIHRQARDNPIVELARLVRAGEPLPHGVFGDSAVIRRNEVDQAAVLAADQVLVGTNRTRRRYNQRLRELEGYEGPLPASGDKMVALRNDQTKGLLNGSLWRVSSAGKAGAKPFMQLLVKADDEGMGGGSVKIKVLKAAFENPDAEIPWQQKRRYDDFDYGYALTTHKAQGSQWNDVYLFDESYAFKDHPERWLYTAITRAAERITIVK